MISDKVLGFLDEIYRQTKVGSRSFSVGDQLDIWMVDVDYLEIDELLEKIDMEKIEELSSYEVMLDLAKEILYMTYCIKDELGYRKEFFDQVNGRVTAQEGEIIAHQCLYYLE